MKLRILFAMMIIFTLVLSSCAPAAEAPTEEVAGEEAAAAEEPAEEEVAEEVEEEAAVEPVTLTFWSHWAEEDNKKEVLLYAIDKFEEANPNVTVDVTWWQKSDMFPAMRNAFTAGEGYPDIFYFDRGGLEFIDAGWLLDLTDAIDWSDVKENAILGWTRPGPDGSDGVWAMALEMATDEIYYNKEIFSQLGIEVPDNYQYTADEFYDICAKIREAGIDPFANAVGADTPIMGHYIYSYVLMSQLGADDLIALWKGEKSWKDPDVVKALEYIQTLFDIPVYPSTFSTMQLGESHIYFHTEEAAAMFLVGSWYTGRAFVDPAEGGEPEDFQLGMLRYPAMPDGKGNDLKVSLVSGSISVASMSDKQDLALDLLQTIASTDVGNKWLIDTAVATGIKTTEVGGKYQWYFDEFNKTHEGQRYANAYYGLIMPADLKDAFENILCVGLPLGEITLDDAIEQMEEARLSLSN